MSTKGYRFAVAWIANNDSPADKASPTEIENYVSIGLVADLFGKTTTEVAAAVDRYRQKQLALHTEHQ